MMKHHMLGLFAGLLGFAGALDFAGTHHPNRAQHEARPKIAETAHTKLNAVAWCSRARPVQL